MDRSSLSDDKLGVLLSQEEIAAIKKANAIDPRQPDNAARAVESLLNFIAFIVTFLLAAFFIILLIKSDMKSNNYIKKIHTFLNQKPFAEQKDSSPK